MKTERIYKNRAYFILYTLERGTSITTTNLKDGGEKDPTQVYSKLKEIHENHEHSKKLQEEEFEVRKEVIRLLHSAKDQAPDSEAIRTEIEDIIKKALGNSGTIDSELKREELTEDLYAGFVGELETYLNTITKNNTLDLQIDNKAEDKNVRGAIKRLASSTRRFGRIQKSKKELAGEAITEKLVQAMNGSLSNISGATIESILGSGENSEVLGNKILEYSYNNLVKLKSKTDVVMNFSVPDANTSETLRKIMAYLSVKQSQSLNNNQEIRVVYHASLKNILSLINEKKAKDTLRHQISNMLRGDDINGKKKKYKDVKNRAATDSKEENLKKYGYDIIPSEAFTAQLFDYFLGGVSSTEGGRIDYLVTISQEYKTLRGKSAEAPEKYAEYVFVESLKTIYDYLAEKDTRKPHAVVYSKGNIDTVTISAFYILKTTKHNTKSWKNK